MGKQITEMLKGTLGGIVLAILSGRPAYGYEITAQLRDQGFPDIAEGTVNCLMDKRTFNIANVKAELKAMTAIKKFEKEFENARQPQLQESQNATPNPAAGNVPQQSIYGG